MNQIFITLAFFSALLALSTSGPILESPGTIVKAGDQAVPSGDLHLTPVDSKASGNKSSQAAVYGQSPDAADLGVPVDDIPVQTSIVKSLIEDDVNVDLIDFPGFSSKSEDDGKSSEPKNSKDSGDIATEKPDKVAVKLYSKFSAEQNEKSEMKSSVDETAVASREEHEDQSIVSSGSESSESVRKASNEVVKAPSDGEESPQPLYYSSNSDVTSSPVKSTKKPVAVPAAASGLPNALKFRQVGEKIQIKEELFQNVGQISEGKAKKCNKTKVEGSTSPKPTSDQSNAAVKLANDVSELISDSVDQATKLLIDLEEQVKVYLNTEHSEEILTSTPVPLVYGASGISGSPGISKGEGDPILGETSDENKNINKQGATQIQSMIDEVNRVAQNVESVISELVSSRRYVTAAVFRSLLNYLRRVRISLERLQNRMQTIGVAAAPSPPNLADEASAVAGALGDTSGAAAAGSAVGTITSGYLDAIRDRIYRITDEIRTLISRLRLTFSPASSTPSSSR